MDIQQLIGTYALPVLISGTVGFYFNFAGGFSKEFFEERARKKTHKLTVAQHVFQIYNEASTNSFRVLPRDIEHVNSVMTNLEAIDKKIGDIMTEFVSSWGTFARGRKNNNSADDVKFLGEKHKRAETRRLELLEWANKIRNG